MNSLSTQQGSGAVLLTGLMRVVTGFLAALMLLMSGCAALESRDPAAVVKQRAQARWDALIKGNTQTAYQYLSPGSRAVLTPDAYASSIRQGFWKSAKVDAVTCKTADNCDVGVTIEYEFQGRRTKTPLIETWIREGSEWWYLQR
ncbi:MAG TPA: hypothetical protein VFP44_09590 [Usitatibacter sp.]|nr:hypothetical protein [Usitatibacter sp.]